MALATFVQFVSEFFLTSTFSVSPSDVKSKQKLSYVYALVIILLLRCFSSVIEANLWSVIFLGWTKIVGWTLTSVEEFDSDVFLENPLSISSKLRPLVSGRIVNANIAPRVEAAANIHIVDSIPTTSCRLGYILMIANVNICTMLVVIPPSGPLNLNGYSSEVITQGKVRYPNIEKPTWPPMHAKDTTYGNLNLREKIRSIRFS